MKEIWKDIPGYEGSYQVNNFGIIKSLSRLTDHGKYGKFIMKGRILKPKKHNGYMIVSLRLNNKTVTASIHKLVALAFIENPENKPCVNHINGIKDDNRMENLEWCTYKENMSHAVKTGLNNMKGTNHHKAKLNDNDIRTIRKSRNKISQSKLGEMFNVSQQHINKIMTGKRWEHIV